LVGKTTLARGVVELRQGRYERAIDFFRSGSREIVAAHEDENAGYAAWLLALTLRHAGQTNESRAQAYAGLRLLSPYRRSNYLNNNLSLIDEDANAAGRPNAALAFADEVLQVAGAVAKAEVTALALVGRARDLVAVGRPSDAERDLAAAQQ